MGKCLRITFLALTMSATALGCGGVEGGIDDLEPEPEIDETAPAVLSITPPDGATGVRADAQVVIAFSEPMDQASVAGALHAPGLGDYSLAWNGAGDILTITPETELPYAEGEDPGAIAPHAFQVALGAAASDLAGNRLEQSSGTTFSTLKSIEVVLLPDAALTGWASADEFGEGLLAAAGVNDDDIELRAGFTFSIQPIPAAAVEIAHATFVTKQFAYGDPYTELGNLMIDHVSFASVADAFLPDIHGTMGILSYSEAEDIAAEVTSGVEDDRAHRLQRGALSQFRVRFETGASDSGKVEAVFLGGEAGNTHMVVHYLHP
jgi:hypothetical protein